MYLISHTHTVFRVLSVKFRSGRFVEISSLCFESVFALLRFLGTPERHASSISNTAGVPMFSQE